MHSQPMVAAAGNATSRSTLTHYDVIVMAQSRQARGLISTRCVILDGRVIDQRSGRR